MIEKTLISALLIFLTIRCLRSEVISAARIQILKKQAILQSYSEGFHVSNVTFPCNQTDNRATTDMIRKLLDQVEVKIERVARLEEANMKHLLNYKGGTYMPEYLAPDTWSARNRFPDAKEIRFRGKSSLAKIEKFQRRWKQFRHNSNDDYLNVLHQKPMGKRRKRRQLENFLPKSSDNTRVDMNCSDAGEPSRFDANYLHLCTLCSAKRLLPIDRYPSVINEVFCKPSDNGCLGNGNGKCVETIFNVHILKRRDDICRLCVKDSKALAVNEWETYVESISVGCECLLDKASVYKDQWFSKPQDRLTVG